MAREAIGPDFIPADVLMKQQTENGFVVLPARTLVQLETVTRTPFPLQEGAPVGFTERTQNWGVVGLTRPIEVVSVGETGDSREAFASFVPDSETRRSRESGLDELKKQSWELFRARGENSAREEELFTGMNTVGAQVAAVDRRLGLDFVTPSLRPLSSVIRGSQVVDRGLLSQVLLTVRTSPDFVPHKKAK